MLTRTARRVIPAAMLVTAGLALTACGSDNASSASASATSSTTAPSSSAAPSPTATSSTTDGSGTTGTTDTSTAQNASTAAGSSGSSIPACATSKLTTTAENFGNGAGHTDFQLVFQNTGTTTCTLTGYPGVSFVQAHNEQLGKSAIRTPGTTSTVTLIPNAHAYADVETINGEGGYSAAQCDLTTVPTLRVYPPNQTESTNIPWNKDECVNSSIQNLEVGPVHSNK